MKASLDLTTRYFLLADIDSRLVYVLSLDLGNSSLGIGASVVSISEFARTFSPSAASRLGGGKSGSPLTG